MSDDDERQLVDAARSEPARFAELYDRHFERVYAFVISRVRNREDAEELTAEVFHKALHALPNFEWRGAPFGAWLMRIAANAIADRSVRRARERGTPSDAEPASGDLPADAEIARAQESARLFRLVDALPRDQRDVIVERFVHECSIRDTALRLGKSEGAVKQLQLRAVQQLRARMTRGEAPDA